MFLAGDQGEGYLVKAITLLVVWLASTGETSFHRRTHWRFLALLGSLQVVGIEKLRAILAGGLSLRLGQDTWAAAFHSHPLCLPLARWLGPSAATLAVALPPFLLVACHLRLTRPGPPGPGRQAASASTGKPRSRLRRWLGTRKEPGLVGLLALALMVTWLFPSLLARPGPGPITVAVTQPGWTHRSHPAVRHALQAGDARRVATILLEEAEAAAWRAREQGARLVAWPLDYLNFDPATDRVGRERLLALARRTGAALVLPFGFWTPGGLTHGVAVVYPDSPGVSPEMARPDSPGVLRPEPGAPHAAAPGREPEGRLWSITGVGREGVSFPLDGYQVTYLPLIREAAPPPPPGSTDSPPGTPPPGGVAPPGPLVRAREGLLGPTFPPPGCALVLTTAPPGFSPLNLVARAAAAGAGLVHAGWGVPRDGTGGNALRGSEGISLISDPLRWRTKVSRPGPALLVADVAPGPGAVPPAGLDPLGWLGLVSLPAAALLYRRHPRPPGPRPSRRR